MSEEGPFPLMLHKHRQSLSCPKASMSITVHSSLSRHMLALGTTASDARCLAPPSSDWPTCYAVCWTGIS